MASIDASCWTSGSVWSARQRTETTRSSALTPERSIAAPVTRRVRRVLGHRDGGQLVVEVVAEDCAQRVLVDLVRAVARPGHHGVADVGVDVVDDRPAVGRDRARHEHDGPDPFGETVDDVGGGHPAGRVGDQHDVVIGGDRLHVLDRSVDEVVESHLAHRGRPATAAREVDEDGGAIEVGHDEPPGLPVVAAAVDQDVDGHQSGRYRPRTTAAL